MSFLNKMQIEQKRIDSSNVIRSGLIYSEFKYILMLIYVFKTMTLWSAKNAKYDSADYSFILFFLLIK